MELTTSKSKDSKSRSHPSTTSSKKHMTLATTKKNDSTSAIHKKKDVEDPLSERPCKEHSFLTDVADVREMEQGLLQLLEKFHSGKLRAFGGGSVFDQMDQIREQQERLARLHFDLDVQQDMHRLNSDEARSAANDNLNKLIGQLQGLSSSIQTLHTGDGEVERKAAN
ncbi:hypothetical protein LOTGIDRAFT_229217 [Lottia gigantea]|uniref:Coiled-coil domain-containing protein 28B n=1 Tax=Lottia gigantea TaxID=225164 RepID=V3ZE42_LOTGI|nr:hypothetical protein LOTGIDRAFT_229217 [Lottia gigantea]ESO89363.1 hypothetical protein LOTGIDRAFT_229217 [Lottia gigantea]